MKASIYLGNKSFSTTNSQPRTPEANEVRLDIAYCGICGTDIHIYQGHMDQRVKTPHIIGHELSATIAEVGKEVKGFNAGDVVTIRPLQPGPSVPSDKGYSHISSNLRVIGVDLPGGMQSSLTVPADILHRIPDQLSLRHGAMIEPLAVACHDVRLADVKAGEVVVVIGGGPIGLLIALVARVKGAKVILSEINSYRLQLAANLGFETVNPAEGDLTAMIRNLTGEYLADVVFEVSGARSAVEIMTTVANKRGRIVIVAIHPKPQPVDLLQIFLSELKILGVRVYEAEDFEEAISLAANGQIPLDEMISGVAALEDLQSIFENIESSPQGMKYLIDVAKS